jgi:3-phosphoshikimate 1-carboxyvinyltransferase
MRLPVASGPIHGGITPPPSKSITHRALIAAALCGGETRVVNPLEADDTCLTATALERLGARVRREEAAWTVTGFPAGRPAPDPDGLSGESGHGQPDRDTRAHRDGVLSGTAGIRPDEETVRLELGNSGTSLRLLLPVAALGDRPVILDGVERLRQRPVGPLAVALRALGAGVEFRSAPGYPPVRVRGPLAGGGTALDAGQSSQFLSGLLMAAPRTAAGIKVRVTALSSRPYVDLTVAVLASFGVEVSQPDRDTYHVLPQEPVGPGECRVEGDASAAAFLLAAGVVTGGRVRVEGVGSASIQGDRLFLDLLARMGCGTESGPDWMAASGPPTRGLAADLNDSPDLVPPLAAVALFAPGPTRITGIGHLRLKESDRIAALAAETAKLGADVQEGDDHIAFHPARLHAARVASHGDHRIAMAMAVAGLAIGALELDDPACVAKSYPGFFRDLELLIST